MKLKAATQTLIFLGFSFSTIGFRLGAHEMWKDEWQAFLVARDMGWSQMLSFLYYEGHGALWYLWLKAWVTLGLDNGAFALPISHGILAIVFYALLFFGLKGPLCLRCLFAIGYFPLFEFGLLARGYVLILVAGTLVVSQIQRRQDGLWMAVGMFLLMQTEIYGVLLASALWIYWLSPKWKGSWSRLFNEVWVTTLASLMGGLLFVWTVYPRSSVAGKQSLVYAEDPWSWDRLSSVVAGQWGEAFWQPIKLLGVEGGFWWLALVTLGILFWALDKARARWSLFFYFMAVTLFGLFFYSGGMRQWGTAVLLVCFLFFLEWKEIRSGVDWRRTIAVLVMALQIPYAVVATYRDLRFPFSHAQEVAAFIEDNSSPSSIIIGVNPMEMAPVIGYLDRPFYFLPKGEPQTYFRWLEKIYLPQHDEMQLFADYKGVNGLLICSDRPLAGESYDGLTLWKSFDHYSMKKEHYYLYTLKNQ